ncbi:MAG: M48 family metallopeptidase [Cytophagales bacterium]
MSPHAILNLILIILVSEYLLETFLEYLNFQYLNQPLPAQLQGIYEQDKYQKSLQYQRETAGFGFFSDAFSFALSLIMLIIGGFGWLNSWLQNIINNPLLLSLGFFGFLFIVSDVLGLPFSLYSTFSIEAKYGFNKMDAKTFWIDKLKGYGLTIIVGGIIISLLLVLIQWLGADFWWVFWIAISSIMIFINMFYTSLIVPLFNKLTPLEEGDLKSAIMEYCKKVDFPLDNLFVIDGSKRSTKANAYFSGFGSKKKIVLYDTLIKDHSIEELVAVLAHEVGHYKRKHIIQSMVISVLTVGVTLYILSLMVFNETLSMALGAKENTIHLNLIAFGLLYSPISTITGLLMTILSRKNEYEADDFAKNTFSSEFLIVALKKLSTNNLSNIMPHPWYVFFNYSHPPLLARIRNLEK